MKRRVIIYALLNPAPACITNRGFLLLSLPLLFLSLPLLFLSLLSFTSIASIVPSLLSLANNVCAMASQCCFAKQAVHTIILSSLSLSLLSPSISPLLSLASPLLFSWIKKTTKRISPSLSSCYLFSIALRCLLLGYPSLGVVAVNRSGGDVARKGSLLLLRFS